MGRRPGQFLHLRTVDYTQLLIDANRVENQVLNDEQLRDIHIISNHGEWRQVHTRFMMSALEFGILSVHLFGGKEYKDSEILVFGTATKTLIIKIGDGYTKGDKYGCNPLRYMIPQELAELISNNEVVLIGSDVIICKEMLDLGSGSAYDAHEDTTAMVDFGEFVEAALTDWNLIDMWPNLRGPPSGTLAGSRRRFVRDLLTSRTSALTKMREIIREPMDSTRRSSHLGGGCLS